MKSVANNFKSGGLHEKHVVATWNLGNHPSICLQTQGNQEKPALRWPAAGPSLCLQRILQFYLNTSRIYFMRLLAINPKVTIFKYI